MSDETSGDQPPRKSGVRRFQERMGRIGWVLLVMSGKGGVGKSTVAVNLALSLSMTGIRTGLLDVDVHGPSVPKLLGLSRVKLQASGDDVVPVEVSDQLKVVSLGLLTDGRDDAIIWRGTMKSDIVRQLFEYVAWGDLDCLVVDCPSGTGEEALCVVELLDRARSSALIVTTPQQVATIDVEKSIAFCRQLCLPVTGIIENMGAFTCPHCGEGTDIFLPGGGKRLAERFGIPLLGSIPLDRDIARSGDEEKPYVVHYAAAEIARKFDAIVEQVRPVVLAKM